MVEIIKSKYFQKILLSSLNEKTKLELIKYNKHFQNLMNIKLINYKLYKGKYIIYETQGKGKEYNCDGNLEFEGEYLNGKRNGKGKEYDYWNDELEFEGKYLNGIRNGKGKEYDIFNNIIQFDGEFLYGKRWNGKIMEYYSKDKLRFKGEYINGIKKGTE